MMTTRFLGSVSRLGAETVEAEAEEEEEDMVKGSFLGCLAL